jgi:hypothetical protein
MEGACSASSMLFMECHATPRLSTRAGGACRSPASGWSGCTSPGR